MTETSHYEKYKDVIKKYHKEHPEKVREAKARYTKKKREERERKLLKEYLEKYLKI
jgi:hypothetical protein